MMMINEPHAFVSLAAAASRRRRTRSAAASNPQVLRREQLCSARGVLSVKQ